MCNKVSGSDFIKALEQGHILKCQYNDTYSLEWEDDEKWGKTPILIQNGEPLGHQDLICWMDFTFKDEFTIVKEHKNVNIF